MSLPNRNLNCCPDLPHTNREADPLEPPPADFHCDYCQYLIAKKEHYYFSNHAANLEQKAPKDGIHTWFWLLPELGGYFELTADSNEVKKGIKESGLGVHIDTDNPVLSIVKGVSYIVDCENCKHFLGMLHWDSAGPKKPVSMNNIFDTIF